MTANPFDTANYTDCGFDISHNNSGLDFHQLATTRKYCILKITEGTGFHDPSFVPYATSALMAGIKCLGVYHFAHHGNTTAQINYFLDMFKADIKHIPNPPHFIFMLDLERGANPPLEADGLDMVYQLQAEGINPMIYCGYDYWSKNYAALDKCSCFLAAYNNHPTSPIPWRIPSADTYGWDLWQYTGDFLGPWAKDIPGGTHGMDLSCYNLKKHKQPLEQWWDGIAAATKQPV